VSVPAFYGFFFPDVNGRVSENILGIPNATNKTGDCVNRRFVKVLIDFPRSVIDLDGK